MTSEHYPPSSTPHPLLSAIITIGLGFCLLWAGAFLLHFNSPTEVITTNITVKDKVLLNSFVVHNDPRILDESGRWHSLGTGVYYTDFVVGSTVVVDMRVPKLTGDPMKDQLRTFNNTVILKVYKNV